MKAYDCDVVIVGAGIVGLTLAIALDKAGISCTVVEARSRTEPWSSNLPYGLRVSALTRASENIFRRLGVWSTLMTMRHTPYYHMKVWDPFSRGEIFFSANMLAQPNLGHIIENDVILTALLATCDTAKNITLLFDAPAIDIALSPTPQLRLVDGTILNASLLVGADGARSWLREQVGLSSRVKAYDQSALVATIKTAKKHDFVARQIFLEQGPLAFLPFADENYCSIVWTQQTSQAKTLAEIDEVAFNKYLTKAFQTTLGECQVQGARAAFPLVQSHAKQYFTPGCVLIGDAAHTIHPLAGQGLNLGLLDAACLAEIVAYAALHQRPLASTDTLRKYERKRRWHNGVVMRLMDGFHLGFGPKPSLLMKLRETGMRAINHYSFLKQPIIKQALGMSGPLPALASMDNPDTSSR